MKRQIITLAFFLGFNISAQAGEVALPSGTYKLDPAHSTLVFSVNHLGFSHYTVSFDDFDATLELDVDAPEKSKVTPVIHPKSLDLPTPPEGFKDELLGANWLDAAKFPEITFASTKLEMTGDKTAKIYGDLNLHGAKKPIVLDAVFNGGWEGIDRDPNARAGFSATTSFNRSDFGVAYGIPEAGSNMGVSDEVKVTIEAEFSGPAMKK